MYVIYTLFFIIESTERFVSRLEYAIENHRQNLKVNSHLL